MSVVKNRLREKALAAKGVVSDAMGALEADLDSIIAEKAILEQKRLEAVAPHKEGIADLKSEMDDIKGAHDILSNNPPA